MHVYFKFRDCVDSYMSMLFHYGYASVARSKFDSQNVHSVWKKKRSFQPSWFDSSNQVSNLFGSKPFLARLYESTGRAIAVTPASASASASASALASALASASALLKMLKFLVKVFMSLYLLKLWMDQVDTLHAGRYWSEVLCCTIMAHLGDL